MSSAKTQPARGMRDFLPADVRKREYVIGVIKEVYERYGFEPLETPAVENIETLMGKYGKEGNQLIFKILKRGEHEKTGEADLALRYDLTVPLARVVAQYQNELPKFFKRYQIQPVWRADRPARGRFREFYQCDVDVLGSKSMVVEAELIAAASDALVRLEFNNFMIRLNHREVLTGILEVAGVPKEKHGDALVSLDKLDKIGEEGVLQDFKERKVMFDEAAKKIVQLFLDVSVRIVADAYSNAERGLEDILTPAEAKAMNRAILSRLEEFIGSNEAGSNGIRELREIIELLSASGVDSRTEISPSLARGLSYYTGTIMEISVKDLAGSLAGGGRYDNLVGMFLGKDVPACGFSLGLERIIVVMTERNMFPAGLASSPADVMVTMWNEDSVGESVALATELRSKGVRVDLYPEADKLAKQFKYASSRGIPYVVVIGDDEKARGEVTIKDMSSVAHYRTASGLYKIMNDLARHYLADALQTFRDYRKLAERAFAQIGDEDLFKALDEETNSIAVNMKHMAGNMISRWTDFLTTDGEKPERDRDIEFVILPGTTRDDMVAYWDKGWKSAFDAIEPLRPDDLMRTIRIRGQDHTVMQAIDRQLAHYAYHVGQIVFLAKHFKSSEWQSLSVPRNRSAEFNARIQK